MKKVILTLGAALVLTGCAEAPNPLTDGFVDKTTVVPAAKDATGKVTIPEIYRLHLISYGDIGEPREVWINVDARIYAACPVPAEYPACKQGIEGIE